MDIIELEISTSISITILMLLIIFLSLIFRKIKITIWLNEKYNIKIVSSRIFKEHVFALAYIDEMTEINRSADVLNLINYFEHHYNDQKN